MPAEVLDQAGCLLVTLFGNVSNYYARALAGKCQRRRAADAVRCAGHERDLSCEISFSVHIHLSAPLRSFQPRVSANSSGQLLCLAWQALFSPLPTLARLMS